MVKLVLIFSYIKVKSEDQNDNEYRWLFIRTVIKKKKCFKDMHSNVFMRNFSEILGQYMDLT